MHRTGFEPGNEQGFGEYTGLHVTGFTGVTGFRGINRNICE